MYEILLDNTAKHDLEKLPGNELERISLRIKALPVIPALPVAGKSLCVGSKQDWRIRIGNYRVIYEINDSTKRIIVIKVRHRREIYR